MRIQSTTSYVRNSIHESEQASVSPNHPISQEADAAQQEHLRFLYRTSGGVGEFRDFGLVYDLAVDNQHHNTAAASALNTKAQKTSDSLGSQIAGTLLGTGQALLSRCHRIFKEFPAKFSVKWEFTLSAITGKGGPSKPLANFLDDHSIQHNSNKLHPAPAGSVDKVQQTKKDIGHSNNTNGKVAENALADKYKKRGYRVKQNVTVKTSAGLRDIDIQATKYPGHPTLSEEIRIESKVGKRSLEGTAQGSNNRAQINKDAAALAEHQAKAPAQHALGRTLRSVGKVLRPIGWAMGTWQVGSAYKEDGYRMGSNTQSTIVSFSGSFVGGAGGAWAGATAGAAIGSAVPIVGTVIGAVVGSLLGGCAGGWLGEWGASAAFNPKAQ